MPRITQQMLRARLTEQLGMPQPVLIATPDSDFSGTDLLSIENDEVFLAEAYRRILGRQPDLDGMHHFLQVLKIHPRQVVVDALSSARQSLSATVQQTLQSPAGFVDLTDLDRLEAADELVRESYRRILGREGDREGLSHYRELRYCGVPKAQVLGIIAASAEARRRNLHFLWHGTALPPPGRLGFVRRLQLLFCRLTGRSQLEDALSSLSAEVQRMRQRSEASREDVQIFSTKLLTADASILKKCDAISSEMQAIRAQYEGQREDVQAFSTNLMTANASVSKKYDAISSEMQAIRAHYEGQREDVQAFSTNLMTANANISGKYDAISSEMRTIRAQYEGQREDVQALATKLLDANASISKKCDAISSEMLNANELSIGKLRELASRIENLSGHIQQEVAAAIDRMMAEQALGGSVFDARLGGIYQKLDAISGDVQVREEGLQLGQDLGRAEVSRGMVDLRARADAIAAMIRPPVLAGIDVLVTKVDDFVLAVPRDDWPMAAYYSFWGTLDQGLTRCLLTLARPNMVVVDIGANIGLHTLQAARAVGESGKVYSFEPAPQAFDILRKNVKVSGFQCVELFPFALLDRSDQVQLHLHKGASGLNTLFAEKGADTSVLVEAMTLDEALRGREHVDVVKIDAEGAEPFILRGMKRILAENPALVILLEFAPAHLQRAGVLPAEFLQELRASGFGIQHVDDLTGELTTPMDEWLLNANSSNLHLRRH